MKRIFAMILALCMIVCAGCGNTAAETTTAPVETTTAPAETTVSMVNEGELQLGVYSGTAAYASEGFSMTWTITISFNEDSTFVLVNDAGEEKGAGTWALTGDTYTLTYSDDRTATFVILADGTLEVTTNLPYGKNGISPDQVGGISLSYLGEALPETTEPDATTGATAVAGDFTLAAGTYTGSYTKESAMAGTVTYVYTAVVGEDGSFSYSVTFNMGETPYDGSAASGSYTLENGVFTFTDADGNVTEGTLTGENELTIALMASSMAKEPYEVVFTIAE